MNPTHHFKYKECVSIKCAILRDWGGGEKERGTIQQQLPRALYFAERESLLDLNRSQLLNKLGNARLA
jgi:hypothetical protein